MRQSKLNTLSVFNDAIAKYYERKFAEAKSAFEYILAENPDDAPVQRLLEKTTNFAENGVPDDWSGIEEMFSK